MAHFIPGVLKFVEDNPEATLNEIRRRFAPDLNPEALSYLAELVDRRARE